MTLYTYMFRMQYSKIYGNFNKRSKVLNSAVLCRVVSTCIHVCKCIFDFKDHRYY